MSEINDLTVTDASNTARFPEGMRVNAINDSARELEGLIARWYKDTNGSVAVAGTDTFTATINADTGINRTTIAARLDNGWSISRVLETTTS